MASLLSLVCTYVLSLVQLFVTPWSPLGSSVSAIFQTRYWSELPFPSPGDLPSPRIKPGSPVLQVDSLLSEPPGKPYIMLIETYSTILVLSCHYSHFTVWRLVLLMKIHNSSHASLYPFCKHLQSSQTVLLFWENNQLSIYRVLEPQFSEIFKSHWQNSDFKLLWNVIKISQEYLLSYLWFFFWVSGHGKCWLTEVFLFLFCFPIPPSFQQTVKQCKIVL